MASGDDSPALELQLLKSELHEGVNLPDTDHESCKTISVNFNNGGGDETLPESVICNLSLTTTDSVTLHGMPFRVREKIWNCLDKASLKAVLQTCSQLREEIQQLQLYQCLFCPIRSIIFIIPFLPLRDYLDASSRKNLRLVCKDIKTIMDFCSETDWASCRWRLRLEMNRLGECGEVDYLAEVHSEESTEILSAKKNGLNITIFDIKTQDLKRICTYLQPSDLKSLESVCKEFNRIAQEMQTLCFHEFLEDFGQFHLMDLPSEIHKKILNLCHSNDRANLRLVSKLMQFQVDTLAGVQVHLNDLKWNWNRNCGKLPPAYSLIVTNIENMQSMLYFVSDYNCTLLTRLLLDGPFLAKAMIRILIKCRNLRYIGFTYALQMVSLEDELRKSFPKKRLPLQLPRLKAIDLKIAETHLPANNIFRVHAWTWTNAFEFMKFHLFHMPNLTSFSLCEESIFSHNLLFEVAEKVLKFLEEHRHTLKYVSLILLGHCFRSCSCPQFSTQVSENTLRELKLIKYCHDCDWKISRPFTSVLSAQRTLQELSCYKLSDWEFYAGVIHQNRFTLRAVTIEKNLAPLIDLKAFEPCENLEYLWISQCGMSNNVGRSCSHHDSSQIRSIRFDPRLANLDKLPVSIKRLHILDQTVETSQIKSIPRRLKNLETLELQFLGSWNGKSFGMTASTVSEILTLRKLNCLFLEEISTVDSYLLNCPLQEIISQVNLIPIDCAQIVKCFGCILYGVLVAEQLPSSSFMPEWTDRVSYYFEADAADHRAVMEDPPTEDDAVIGNFWDDDNEEGDGNESEHENEVQN